MTYPDWQPIESAPRDSTRVLVVGDPFWKEHIHVAQWTGKNGFGDLWKSESERSEYGLMHPTHWMPLPTPPSPKAGE